MSLTLFTINIYLEIGKIMKKIQPGSRGKKGIFLDVVICQRHPSPCNGRGYERIAEDFGKVLKK